MFLQVSLQCVLEGLGWGRGGGLINNPFFNTLFSVNYYGNLSSWDGGEVR